MYVNALAKKRNKIKYTYTRTRRGEVLCFRIIKYVRVRRCKKNICACMGQCTVHYLFTNVTSGYCAGSHINYKWQILERKQESFVPLSTQHCLHYAGVSIHRSLKNYSPINWFNPRTHTNPCDNSHPPPHCYYALLVVVVFFYGPSAPLISNHFWDTKDSGYNRYGIHNGRAAGLWIMFCRSQLVFLKGTTFAIKYSCNVTAWWQRWQCKMHGTHLQLHMGNTMASATVHMLHFKVYWLP